MAKTIRILLVCGTAIATSVAAADRIKTLMKPRGYEVTTWTALAAEVYEKAKSLKPHMNVPTTKIKINKIEKNGTTRFEVDGIPGIPAFNGVPFLTGVGEEELIDKMIAALKEIESDKLL